MIKLEGLWYGPVTDRHWNGESYGPVQAYKEANDLERESHPAMYRD